MTRIALTAAAALIALAAAMPAQAGGIWYPNGVSPNGLELNGRNMQGRSMQGRNMQGINLQGRNMQGVTLNGAQGAEVTGGVSLLAIELAR